MNGVALVTGGSRGIGRGISEALALKGWTVAVNYRSNTAAAEETLRCIREKGGRAFSLQADISDLSRHDGLLREIIQKEGRLDILVNNAGIAPRNRTDILELSPEQYDEMMHTNLRGPFFLTQKTGGLMAELLKKNRIGSPKIITITSISAETVSVNRGEYCISKAGLSMLSKLFAARLAEYGIDVYEIRPGIIETDMTEAVKEKYDRLIDGGLVPRSRWGTPEDVGKAVSALAEGSFPYSTGNVFYLDGGMHLPRL